MTSRASCGATWPASSADGTDSTAPGLQPVHVLAHEGLRVGAEQRHQHLVERDAGPLRAGGDAAAACRRLRTRHLVGRGCRAGRAARGARRTGGPRRRAVPARRRPDAPPGAAPAWRGRRRAVPRHCGAARPAPAPPPARRRRRPAACASARPGGSNSSVYSRTSRPEAQVASMMTSTKGSSTARSLVTRSTGRPSGRRTTCTWPTAARRCSRRRRRGRPRAAPRAGCSDAASSARHAGDVDLGPQRFAQRRLHRQPAQAQRPGRRAPQAGGGQGHRGQRKARCIRRTVFQGMSPIAIGRGSARSRPPTRQATVTGRPPAGQAAEIATASSI